MHEAGSTGSYENLPPSWVPQVSVRASHESQQTSILKNKQDKTVNVWKGLLGMGTSTYTKAKEQSGLEESKHLQMEGG